MGRKTARYSTALVVLLAGVATVGITRAAEAEVDTPLQAGLQVGVTHTQFSADPWNPPAAVTRARDILRDTVTYQNQHIMGFGALNPEPSPGVYDWESLDSRMDLIADSGGTPVITLCCAPDWMKGGQPGETDWSRIEDAPLPAYFDDFADLAAQVAQRYPHVLHYQVWNELKGFFLAAENRWDYEGYTQLYNAVYDALKAVNPAIQVGGPYVVIGKWASGGSHPSLELRDEDTWGIADQRSLDVIDYWLANAHGAQFITVDGNSTTQDAGLIADAVAATKFFGDATAWVAQRTNLPIWWAEFYPIAEPGQGPNSPRQTEVVLAALQHMASAGADLALLWEPEQTAPPAFPGLWSSTATAGGGQCTPLTVPVAQRNGLGPPTC